MILKLIKAYGISPPGEILRSVSKPIAEILIGRGIAEIIMGKRKQSKKSPRAT